MALEEGGGSAAARRKPSWRERENNRRRERRRRAIAAKIFGGLRARGNFNLPKHCDNNEVLKSLCKEAGWVVEEDGTTYRKGCERPPPMDVVGTSNDVTPYASQLQSPMSSAFQTPIPSYQVSPSSSMCPSPSHFPGTPSAAQFPFFYNTLMSSLPPLRISNSCPVTPPPSSPNSKAPPKSVNWEVIVQEPVNSFKYPIFAASAPASPIRHQLFTPATIPECDESDSSTVDSGHWASFRSQMPFGASASPTFNLIKPAEQVRIGNGVDLKGKGLAVDVGKGLNLGLGIDQVKPWEGERISEFGFDDLELTLGSGKTHT